MTMRVFMAIDLPDPVREEIAVLQQALSVGRPVPSENLHLTLCFLGDQSDDALEEAHDALSSIRRPAFDMHLAGLGTFGAPTPTMVFADVARSEPLIDLGREVNRKLRAAGVQFQKQRFRPHVTIARMPKVLPAFGLASVQEFLGAHGGFRGAEFRVRVFNLYRSTLLPGSARHEILAHYDLSDV